MHQNEQETKDQTLRISQIHNNTQHKQTIKTNIRTKKPKEKERIQQHLQQLRLQQSTWLVKSNQTKTK